MLDFTDLHGTARRASGSEKPQNPARSGGGKGQQSLGVARRAGRAELEGNRSAVLDTPQKLQDVAEELRTGVWVRRAGLWPGQGESSSWLLRGVLAWLEDSLG